jgi:transcriptional regulator with XRE-family HTH domain
MMTDKLGYLYCVGHNLKEARKKKGLTQAQLAEMVGTSPKYISRIENYRANFSVYLAYKIAWVLKVPMDELFSGIDDPF